MKNYLYELNECLSYALNNIAYTNTNTNINKIKNDTENEKIFELDLFKKIIKENKEKFEELKNKIIITADEIFEDYSTAIEKSEEEIFLKAKKEFLAISEFGEYKSETATTIKENADAIELNSSNIETANNNLENFKAENNAELNLRAQAIISQVESIFSKKSEYEEFTETVSSKITQTTKNITENFETSISGAKEELSTLGGTVSELIYSLDAYIKRGELESGVFGIEIGRSDSNIKARFTNEKLSFLQGSTEVAYISGNNLHILRAEIIDYIKIGDSNKGYFSFDVTDNGLEVRWSYGN